MACVHGKVRPQVTSIIVLLARLMIFLCSSAYRPLRFTSTTASLFILHGLSKLQFGPQKRKGPSDIAPLTPTQQSLFDGVFVQRYRDIDPQIRELCLAQLCEWINDYPSGFLDNSFLRYLGWSLSDKTARVRKLAVQSVKTLFKPPKWRLEYLKAFYDRFKQRIMEMAMKDVDEHVRSAALQAIGTIVDSDPCLINERASKELIQHLIKGKDVSGLKTIKSLLRDYFLEDTADDSTLYITNLCEGLDNDVELINAVTPLTAQDINEADVMHIVKARYLYTGIDGAQGGHGAIHLAPDGSDRGRL